MKYKDALKTAMNNLAQDPKTLFVGYNVACGSKANGTLVDIPQNKLIEYPVSENLILGSTIGLSIEGFKPVVYLERFDFILCALDAVVNHLDKIKEISHGEFNPKVIIRCVIGGTKKPLYTGITHTQDLTKGIRELVSFPVIKVKDPIHILNIYNEAMHSDSSYIIVEERDKYDEK